MIAILFYIIWFANIGLVLLRKKSKFVTICSICISTTIYFLNIGSGDYNGYKLIYDSTDSFIEIESGFKLIIMPFKNLGLSFNQFQGIICLICLLVILYIYRKYSDNFQFFFAIYFIYQYFYHLDTLRFFLTCTIFVVAFHNLSKDRKIIYAILIIMAIPIHRTALFLLPIVFLNPKDSFNKKIVESVTLILFFVCTFAILAGSRFQYISSLFLGITNGAGLADKANAYFNNQVHWGFLIYFGLHFGNMISIQQCNIRDEETLPEKMMFARYCWMANAYAFLSFPLIMISTIFFRLFNYLLLIDIIVWAMQLDKDRTESINKYYNHIFLFLILMFLYKLPFVHASYEMISVLEAL